MLLLERNKARETRTCVVYNNPKLIPYVFFADIHVGFTMKQTVIDHALELVLNQAEL